MRQYHGRSIAHETTHAHLTECRRADGQHIALIIKKKKEIAQKVVKLARKATDAQNVGCTDD
jgi:hypothetical protein